MVEAWSNEIGQLYSSTRLFAWTNLPFWLAHTHTLTHKHINTHTHTLSYDTNQHTHTHTHIRTLMSIHHPWSLGTHCQSDRLPIIGLFCFWENTEKERERERGLMHRRLQYGHLFQRLWMHRFFRVFRLRYNWQCKSWCICAYTTVLSSIRLAFKIPLSSRHIV